ncbi:hypothetical protein LCGC14_0262580 [marine sediment metagenome]|uniref:Uncharacterized protein n=1 Tax=marine sediment metagenome TaxID=412755 RepID=A0A0F9U5V6_9ZZZZ
MEKVVKYDPGKPADGYPLQWAIPAELKIPADPLRCRLDFHHQAVVMTIFNQETTERRIVSAMNVSHALANELSFGTGLLPPNILWWNNSRNGVIFALYCEPKVRTLALQEDVNKPPLRFTIPLPGLIFLCSPGQPPWVYAVKKRPTKETDIVYKAPLCNIHENGRSCPGNHKYPERVTDIVESFFISFFSPGLDMRNRSVRFESNIVLLWNHLNKKKKFPNDDLVKHGTVKDLMQYE